MLNRAFAVMAMGTLLLQGVIGLPAAGVTEGQHTRYERAIGTGERTAGQTCAVLDALVLEHAANRAGNDLRLYAGEGADAQETPFALTESSSTPGDVETVNVSQEAVHGSAVEFDLQMPDRPYSEIDLNFAEKDFTGGKDFIATARATGFPQKGAAGHALGTVTLFDFSSQGLPRSTNLQLGESSDPWVHLKLRFFDVQGRPLTQRAPLVVAASVPPSRQAQILYTAVAETRVVVAGATGSEATLAIGAHVPVERVRLELAPEWKADFLRRVTVTAQSKGSAGSSGEEVFEGEVGRLTRPDPGPGIPPIRFEHLAVSAALGANLRSEATVHVHTASGDKGTLPIRAVILEMRRRSLCFEAKAGMKYVLHYGDALLPAPAYSYARTFRADANATMAQLGVERVNPAFVPREAGRGWITKSPELVWVGLIAVLALVGAVVLERLRRHKTGV